MQMQRGFGLNGLFRVMAREPRGAGGAQVGVPYDAYIRSSKA